MGLTYYNLNLKIEAVTPFTILSDPSRDLNFLQYTADQEYLYWLDKSIYHKEEELGEFIIKSHQLPLGQLKRSVQEKLRSVNYHNYVKAKIKLAEQMDTEFHDRPPLNIRTLPYITTPEGKPRFYIPGSSIKGMLNSLLGTATTKETMLESVWGIAPTDSNQRNERTIILKDVELSEEYIVVGKIFRMKLIRPASPTSIRRTPRGIPQTTLLVAPQTTISTTITFRIDSDSEVHRIIHKLRILLQISKRKLVDQLQYELTNLYPQNPIRRGSLLKAYEKYLLKGNQSAPSNGIYFLLGFGAKKIKRDRQKHYIMFLKKNRRRGVTTSWAIPVEGTPQPLGIVKLTFEF